MTTERENEDGKMGESAQRLQLESIYHPMRCDPETTLPWEPIAATLTRGQKWTRAAGVDWSSGTAVGEGG